MKSLLWRTSSHTLGHKRIHRTGSREGRVLVRLSWGTTEARVQPTGESVSGSRRPSCRTGNVYLESWVLDSLILLTQERRHKCRLCNKESAINTRRFSISVLHKVLRVTTKWSIVVVVRTLTQRGSPDTSSGQTPVELGLDSELQDDSEVHQVWTPIKMYPKKISNWIKQ